MPGRLIRPGNILTTGDGRGPSRPGNPGRLITGAIAPPVGDDFESGTTLTGRTTPVGGLSWTDQVGTFSISAGAAIPASNTDGYIATFPGAVGTCTVTADVVPRGAGVNSNSPGIVFRFIDTSNYWYCYPLIGATPTFFIRKVVAGVHNVIAEIPFSGVVSDTVLSVQLDLAGPDIRLSLNGTEILTVTDWDSANSTVIGLRYGRTGTTVTAGQWNFLQVGTYQGARYTWPQPAYAATNPQIPLGSAGTWDSTDINNPNVVWDPVNTRWVMCYTGYWNNAGADSGIQSMGIATATAPEGPWTKASGNPVFTDAAAGYYNMNGGIIYWGGLWYHAYGSGNGTTISLATSPDLVTWTTRGVVVSGGWASSVFDAFLRVRQNGTTIELWYGGAVSGGRSIGYATSTDGLSYTKQATPTLTRPAFAAGNTFSEPSVYVPPGQEGTQMLICCDVSAPSSNDVRRIAQAVTLDGGVTWHWRLLAGPYGAPGSWAANGVFDSFQLVTGGRYYLYSSGAPTAGTALNLSIQIGYATADWNGALTVVSDPTAATMFGHGFTGGFNGTTGALTSAVAMAGSGALTVTGVDTVPAVVGMAGAGSLTVTPTVTRTGVLAMAGAGSLSVAGTDTTSATVTMSGTGTLTVTPAVTAAGVVAITGTGSLTVTGSDTTTSTVALTGAGALTVTGTTFGITTVTMAGAGTLTVTGSDSTTATVTMPGAGSLVVTATPIHLGTISLTGSGTLTVIPAVTLVPAVTMVGAGTLSVIGTDTTTAVVAMAGVGALTVTVTVSGINAVTFTGAGGLTVTGTDTTTATITLTGAGTLTVIGSTSGIITVTMTGAGALNVNPTFTQFGAVPMVGAGTLTVTSTGQQTAAVTIVGAGALTVVALPTHTVTLPFTGAGALTVTSTTTRVGTIPITGAGALTVSGIQTHTAIITLSGAGALTIATPAVTPLFIMPSYPICVLTPNQMEAQLT